MVVAIVLTLPHMASAQVTEQYIPGGWIDPDGCDHWVMDDSVEGYLSPRLDARGRPVRSGTPVPPNTALGNFKGGATSFIGDAL